jgi:hypothetical protein
LQWLNGIGIPLLLGKVIDRETVGTDASDRELAANVEKVSLD